MIVYVICFVMNSINSERILTGKVRGCQQALRGAWQQYPENIPVKKGGISWKLAVSIGQS